MEITRGGRGVLERGKGVKERREGGGRDSVLNGTLQGVLRLLGNITLVTVYVEKVTIYIHFL